MPHILPQILFSIRLSHHLDMHSLPTRRSSDLPACARTAGVPVQRVRGGAWWSAGRARGHGAWMRLLRHRATDDQPDRKSTRLNSSHVAISYAVFCLKKRNLSTKILARTMIATK